MDKTQVNEFGDRVGKKEICQGILMFGCLTGLMVLACLRVCHEIQKKKEKAIQKNQMAEQIKKVAETNRVSYIVLPQKQR